MASNPLNTNDGAPWPEVDSGLYITETLVMFFHTRPLQLETTVGIQPEALLNSLAESTVHSLPTRSPVSAIGGTSLKFLISSKSRLPPSLALAAAN